jgi:phospholipid/cholesterol/gamma-HCH transport system substrate-binding protein
MTRRPTNLAAARAARRARRELTLGLCLLAAVGLAGWISTVAINGVPWASAYQVRIALPAGAPVLTSGDDVRLAGERVGQVESVTPPRQPGAPSVATLSVSQPLGAGARARIRPRGMAGAVYVDLTTGRSGRPLHSGSLIPAVGSVQLTDVIAGFDGAARRAMARTLTGYGTGLSGRGETVGRVLASAPALLGNGAATLRALQPSPGALSGAIGSARSLAGALAPPRDGTLGGLLQASAAVLQTTGDHATVLSRAVAAVPGVQQAMGGVLPSADRLLAQLDTTATQLQPGVEALGAALPSLGRLESSSPSVTTLGDVAATAAPALRALSPALGDLRGPAAGLTPLTTPIWTLAQVLIPYREQLLQAPLGFTRWGNFSYDFGTGAGHRAVRFSMVLTCALARDPYPAPGAAAKEHKSCP